MTRIETALEDRKNKALKTKGRRTLLLSHVCLSVLFFLSSSSIHNQHAPKSMETAFFGWSWRAPTKIPARQARRLRLTTILHKGKTHLVPVFMVCAAICQVQHSIREDFMHTKLIRAWFHYYVAHWCTEHDKVCPNKRLLLFPAFLSQLEGYYNCWCAEIYSYESTA